MLLGYARGAVGNLVFSRVKGNEVTKARNRQPANPKTSKQVYQRAKFLNAVNFYKRGVQNLFKFAYEDKTQQESDFNAFMRHNVSRAIPVGKGASTETAYPAIANWITSVGSLNGPQAVIGFEGLGDEASLGLSRLYAAGQYNVSPSTNPDADITFESEAIAVIAFKLPAAAATLGALSTQLKTEYPDLQEGDIVTITMIHQILQGVGQPATLLPSAYGMDGAANSPTWKFMQFAIDSLSTKTIAQAIGDEIYLSEGLTFSVADNDRTARLSYSKTWAQYYDEIIGGSVDPDTFANISSCVAGVMTFSRNTVNGLRVSTQELSTSEGFQKMIELSQTTAFTEQVLRTWDAADLAILEGGFIQA